MAAMEMAIKRQKSPNYSIKVLTIDRKEARAFENREDLNRFETTMLRRREGCLVMGVRQNKNSHIRASRSDVLPLYYYS